MIKMSISLQDLRRRIYAKVKADSTGTGGVGQPESAASSISLITLGVKPTGQLGEGDPHAGLDVAGAGNVAMGAGLRPRAKALEELPDSKARAPVLDPTCAEGGRATAPFTATASTPLSFSKPIQGT